MSAAMLQLCVEVSVAIDIDSPSDRAKLFEKQGHKHEEYNMQCINRHFVFLRVPNFLVPTAKTNSILVSFDVAFIYIPFQ